MAGLTALSCGYATGQRVLVSELDGEMHGR
jgi:hypothetical protein